MVPVAGGIIWNPRKGVVVVNQHHDSWSLPKGHVETGESLHAAAIREIREETGIPPDQLTLVTKIASYVRPRIKKHPDDEPEERRITLFFFTTEAERLVPEDPDNPEARWVKPEEVTGYLTHEKDREVFLKFIAEHPLTLHE